MSGKKFFKFFLAAFFAIFFVEKANAAYKYKIVGDNPQEVQENAFRKGMDYPVGPLECKQRCSQWWERQSNN